MSHPKNFVDRTGLVYGKLTVIESAGYSQELQRAMWKCKCSCGNICVIQGKLLKNGTTKSCGCLRREVPRTDLSGKRFGIYTVIKFVDKNQGGRPRRRFLCRCDCGAERIFTASQINTGKPRSCGCLTNQIISEKNSTHGESHGEKRTKEYRAWRSIKQRCLLETNKSFRIYGARGILICPTWVNSFETFLLDMGRAPTLQHSIERKDNNGNYEPGNCYWSTPLIQARNRRTNVFATHEGKTQCALDWSRELKVPIWTVLRRLRKGLSIAQIKSEFS